MIKFVGFLSFLLAIFNIWKLVINLNSDFCQISQQPILQFAIKQRDICIQDWITVHSVVNYGGSRFDLTDRVIMILYLTAFLLLVSIFQLYLDKVALLTTLKHNTAAHWSVVVGIAD